MANSEWHSIQPAPIILVRGTESLIAQRAMERIKTLLHEQHPDLAVHDLPGESGATLPQVASPSLFGEPRLVIVRELHQASAELIDDVLTYLKDPADDVVLLLIHGGGNRGKKLLDALSKTKVPTVDASPIKRPADKQTFVAAEFSRAGRSIQPEAVAELVDAFGADLAELAATSQQLIADTTPEDGANPAPITRDDVHALTAGRVETTAFAVADAAIAGREQIALQLLQQALLAGVAPVPLVAAVASKVRSLAKVTAPGADASALGMPPWMHRNLSREARGWTDRSLARAIEAVAQADHAVKGAGRDPQWAAQRMVMEICRARRAG